MANANRNYYLKAYAGWWTGLALLGSAYWNGRSETFLGSTYNPAIWSGAALLSLLIATLHAHYRDAIRRAADHPLVFWVGIFGFIVLQITNLWERQATRPSLLYGILLGVLCFSALFLLVVCLAGVHQTFFDKPKKASLSTEAP